MALGDLSALQLLDADPEPCFVVDCSQSQAPIAWTNAALQNDAALLGAIRQAHQTNANFWSWLGGPLHAPSFRFLAKSWTAFRCHEQWIVVRGQQPTSQALDSHANEQIKRLKDVRDLGHKLGRDQASDTVSHPSAPPRTHPIVFDRASQQSTMDADVRLSIFDQLMKTSDIGLFEIHPDGWVMHANDSWYRLSGHPRDLDKHIDFSFMDLVYHEDVPAVTESWTMLAQGLHVNFEFRWKGASDGPRTSDLDDGVQWVLCNAVPIFNSTTGEVISIAGNIVDLSLQKKSISVANQRAEALARARESETKFSRFAQLAPLAIYIFGADQKCRYCNDQFFELSGMQKVPVEEVDWRTFVHEEDLAIGEDGVETLYREKKSVIRVFRLKRKWRGPDGIQRHVCVQASSFPELDEHGNIKHIMGTLLDISQFRFAETIQKVRVDEALEAKRQQENFIDTTSHEMRNPLSAVVQCADSLVDSLTDIIKSFTALEVVDRLERPSTVDRITRELRSGLDAAQTIISCSTHQKRIIDDVLTFSKLDGDLLLVTPIPVKPAQVIKDAMRMFELECAKLDIELLLKSDPSMRDLVTECLWLDPSRLIQILINLLTNAIKFTQGRPRRRITVTLGVWRGQPDPRENESRVGTPSGSEPNDKEKEGAADPEVKYLWVSIEDTGCGLTPLQQDSLFTRFTQATPRTHVQYGGSGLGLFISKALAEKQGGGIAVRSEEDVGSAFTFYISTSAAPLSSRETTSNGTIAPAAGGSDLEERLKATRHSVLIVEDNITNQKVLAKQLERAGCVVHIANHGEEALDTLKRSLWWKGQEATGEHLAIVLLDIEMPVMDGKTCVQTIRSLEASGEVVGHVPVLGMSANARAEQVKEALQAGMDDAIAKPFRIAELLPKLDRLASKRKPESYHVDGRSSRQKMS